MQTTEKFDISLITKNCIQKILFLIYIVIETILLNLVISKHSESYYMWCRISGKEDDNSSNADNRF